AEEPPALRGVVIAILVLRAQVVLETPRLVWRAAVSSLAVETSPPRSVPRRVRLQAGEQIQTRDDLPLLGDPRALRRVVRLEVVPGVGFERRLAGEEGAQHPLARRLHGRGGINDLS